MTNEEMLTYLFNQVPYNEEDYHIIEDYYIKLSKALERLEELENDKQTIERLELENDKQTIELHIEVNLQDRRFKNDIIGYINGYLEALLDYGAINVEECIQLNKEIIRDYD